MKLFSPLLVVLLVAPSVVRTFLRPPFVLFSFSHGSSMGAHENIDFWGFDFICNCFWVWGDVAEMDLLLDWRKTSPMDIKFIIF